jgi:hypothetical protein
MNGERLIGPFHSDFWPPVIGEGGRLNTWELVINSSPGEHDILRLYDRNNFKGEEWALGSRNSDFANDREFCYVARSLENRRMG